MATESFYEDMIIDTPEKAKALEDVLENGEPYRIKYPDISYDDPEIIRRFKENYRRERQTDIPDGTASDDSTCLRPRSRTVGRPSVPDMAMALLSLHSRRTPWQATLSIKS